jgi:hypothetical protein
LNFIHRSYSDLWLIDMLFTHITGVTVIAYVHNTVFRLCNVQMITLKTFCTGDISADTGFQSTHMKQKKNNYRTLYFKIFQY